MLRQRDIIKYKTKSKFDHILFLRKDAEYLLRNNRPIKENLIPNLNDIKVHQFIEDILTNKKISKLLFTKNSIWIIDSAKMYVLNHPGHFQGIIK